MDRKKIFEEILGVTKVVAPAVVTQQVYSKMFNHHFLTFKPFYFEQCDFPNLTSKRYTFYSCNKHRLVGYIYSDNSVQKRGIFVFCHGYGGGGHHCYLDLINVLCTMGFYVFAYDATANDESEGTTIKGFTQGFLDADKALSFVESLDEYKKLPLYLMGHSWGAYSSSVALEYHKRVKGLVAFSGFNSATTIFKANGERFAGEKANDFMLYVDTYERFLFGKICESNALHSFANSKAKIVIVHSEDDTTVPIEAGFTMYKKQFGKDKRFKFIKLLEHGHGTVYYTLEGKHYYDKVHHEYDKFVKKNKPNEEAKVAYLKEHIDREKYNHMVDTKLIKKCIDFITK